jgi:predicted ATPase
MLTSLTLTHFKSFRRAAVPLGPLTLIVGANASGKSNLRDAFRFLHGIGRGYALAEILGEKWGEGGELQWRGIRGGSREVAYTGENEFSLEADLRTVRPGPVGTPGVSLRYRITVAPGDPSLGPRVSRESLHVGDHMLFDSHPAKDAPNQKDEEHLTVRLRRVGFVGPHRPAQTFLSNAPVLLQAVRKSVPHLRSAEAAIATFASIRFLDLSPDAMRIPSLPGVYALGDRGENLSSALLALCKDPSRKAVLLDWLGALTPLDVADLDFLQDFSGRVLVHLVERSGRKVSAHSASDGTLRFLAILAALLDPERAHTYFIEEIENGIHPTRLHLLVQLLEQQCQSGRVQVVATTHSPGLLAFLSAASRKHALLIARREGEEESHVRPILSLPDAPRVLEGRDLGELFSSGWLENAAAFLPSEPDGAEAAQ